MTKKIVLPELGEGIDKAIIACWHKRVGDHVSEDDDLLEVVTDKATFNVPVGCRGIVQKIFFNQGEEVTIGAALAVIDLTQ